jgi:hypothetical protein
MGRLSDELTCDQLRRPLSPFSRHPGTASYGDGRTEVSTTLPFICLVVVCIREHAKPFASASRLCLDCACSYSRPCRLSKLWTHTSLYGRCSHLFLLRMLMPPARELPPRNRQAARILRGHPLDSDLLPQSPHRLLLFKGLETRPSPFRNQLGTSTSWGCIFVVLAQGQAFGCRSFDRRRPSEERKGRRRLEGECGGGLSREEG